MKYVILPHIGTINLVTQTTIQFGLRKSKFHNLHNSDPKFSMGTMEYYEDFRVDYTDDENINAIEFFNWAEVCINLNFGGISNNQNLFEIPFSILNTLIVKNDPEAKISDSGVISLSIGLGTYHEDAESDKCESIIIFQKGYYSRLGW